MIRYVHVVGASPSRCWGVVVFRQSALPASLLLVATASAGDRPPAEVRLLFTGGIWLAGGCLSAVGEAREWQKEAVVRRRHPVRERIRSLVRQLPLGPGYSTSPACPGIRPQNR